jgi:hypothetical protein
MAIQYMGMAVGCSLMAVFVAWDLWQILRGVRARRTLPLRPLKGRHACTDPVRRLLRRRAGRRAAAVLLLATTVGIIVVAGLGHPLETSSCPSSAASSPSSCSPCRCSSSPANCWRRVAWAAHRRVRRVLFGWLPGGLGVVTVMSCTMFGGVSARRSPTRRRSARW